MKIDIGSFMFNIDMERGGSPGWGTALGQKSGYNFDTDKYGVDIFSSLLNKSIDLNKFECKLGKGGNSDNYEIILASLFDKVFVNNELINNAKFLTFIVREHNESHNGRKILKYNKDATYDKVAYNNDCISKIKDHFKLKNDSPWIITHINFSGQDEIHLKAYFFKETKKIFKTAKERTEWIQFNIEQTDKTNEVDKNNFLVEKFNLIKKMIGKTWDSIRYFAFNYYNDIEEIDLKELYNKLEVKSTTNYNSFKLEIDKGIELAKNAANYKLDSTKVYNFEIPRKAKNLVVFGTPGCGKSYYVNNTLLKDYPNLADNTKERVIRTTFYQDYTYTDFVGQILPYIEYDVNTENGKKEERVTYKFTPGPFALALKEAVLNRDKEVALVIEELNRGNAPAIFGDIFQLLDRNKDGISEYAITNIHLRDWLNNEIEDANFDKIKIPGNLNIFATMNTSDQNVFTLDTAFKRRWKFEKLSNDFDDYKELYGKEHPFKDDFIPGMSETWKSFVETINDAILKEIDITMSEDKQLGIFFVDETGLVKKELLDSDENKKEKAKEFAYKIFEYLWDDVLKYCHEKWFGKDVKSLDALIKKYLDNVDNNNGAEVFKNGIFDED